MKRVIERKIEIDVLEASIEGRYFNIEASVIFDGEEYTMMFNDDFEIEPEEMEELLNDDDFILEKVMIELGESL